MIARAFLGTYSTHNTHIFYRHPIFELFAKAHQAKASSSLRLIKLKQAVELPFTMQKNYLPLPLLRAVP